MEIKDIGTIMAENTYEKDGQCYSDITTIMKIYAEQYLRLAAERVTLNGYSKITKENDCYECGGNSIDEDSILDIIKELK